jgi:signal transduction histidine kinase
VAPHADRATVRVELTTPPGALRLVIADDGPGFDGTAVLDRAANDGHLGIAGMRERIAALGGRVDVQSAAGTGVRIEIALATREDTA